MKKQRLVLLLAVLLAGTACAQTAATPSPSAPPQRSAAELEKLVAPIALYPDPLIATILPASVYPLEIVQAARFVQDTNNLAKLDEQPWDENVKAVARIPAAIKKMNDDLSWTVDLGEAFLAQDKAVMDMIQTLRAKAEKAGTLQTTPQQVVTVTNMVVEKTVSAQVVYVTNTVVQIAPSNPQVIYVPTYNPYTVYYPPPTYVYNPVAPLITFGAGIAMGAIIANNCDWYRGGCYHNDVNININNNNINNVNRNNNYNQNNNINRNPAGQTKWQPDQSRLNKSGANTSATSAQARGWGSGAQPGATTRPATTSNFTRPTTTPAPSSFNRPTTGAGAGAARPAASPSAGSRPAVPPSASRPSASPSVSQSRPSSSGSAFSGMNSGSSARAASSRGAVSRGGGGGGRGGGGRR